ncbi:LysR family transcriptional regulator [Actinomadura sp. WMMB 499]|uniref:LysR family transcriptional regulator n=1 Tax=Actinomadura sp. WMMB 499 TaxID=1219491 RepID=UPI00124623AC|nr:LysR family transcriptional regulator [Actinomadura sp. WMMB 499]QFG22235.1 LysR family transcriptional regulator [Actinomadura sp. WMMB 499]
MFSLRQLQYLVTVVDEGSFTRAAEALHVTQPALSHQIRALERAAGAPLLERLPRAVGLTPAGRAMLPHARAALSDASRAESAVRQAADLSAGELRLATVYSVSIGVLPATLRTWSRRYPGIDVRLFEHRHADELAEAMTVGQADLAIGPPPSGWTGPVHRLGTEEFVVAVPADDPLAVRGAAEVELAALRDRRWVHYGPDNGLADILDRACHDAGFRPRTAVRTEQTASAPTLAAAGLGPALFPANLVPDGYEGHILRPVPAVTRVLAAYSRTRLDGLSGAFLAVLVENASGLLAAPGTGPA